MVNSVACRQSPREGGRLAAIQRIAQDRQTHVRQVQADLVGAPGLGDGLDHRKRLPLPLRADPPPVHHPAAGASGLAGGVLARGHPVAPVAIPCDGRVDG